MIAAHKGMNITEAEYAAVTDDILIALAKNRIDDATTKDVTAILDSLGIKWSASDLTRWV